MTSETPEKPAASEPSMEDILASIRRILAEDSTDDAGKETPSQPLTSNLFDETNVETPPPPRPTTLSFDDELEAVEVRPDPPPAPPQPPAADVFVLTPEMRIEAEPGVPAATQVAPPSPPLSPPPPTRAAFPVGSGRRVVSAPAADVSADVLAHLAKAILDRRDIAVSTRDVTLEGMVREMLRPLLREWLDRNLPYLIERLVKKEIDLMVNRAERLDD
ncbi:MAG: DUF2497 domain-containing protein [Rhodospirillales bacterium]|nr:DUF2497 domain-containing protein [Rhodospirillales bacterium]